MKNRDLENFAKYFTTTLNAGMGHVDAYYKRKNDIIISEAKRQQDAIKEAREDRRSEQWIAQSKAYMDYLNRKGVGGGAKGGKTAQPAGMSNFARETAGELGVPPAVETPSPVFNVTTQQADPEPAPPGNYPFNRGGAVRPRYAGGGMADDAYMSLDEAMRGGPGGHKGDPNAGGKAAADAGGSSLGQAIGKWAAKQGQTTEAGSGEVFRRGGSVGAIQTRAPRYEDGGRVHLLEPKGDVITKRFPMAGGHAMVGANYDPVGRYGQAEAGYERDVGRGTTLGVQGNIGKDLGPDGQHAKPDWGVGVRGRIRFADGGRAPPGAGGGFLGLFPSTSPEDRAAIEAEAQAKARARDELRRQMGVDPVPPNPISIWPPTSPRDRDDAVRAQGSALPVPERDVNMFPPMSDEARKRMVDQDIENRRSTEDRRAIRAGSGRAFEHHPDDTHPASGADAPEPFQHHPDDTHPASGAPGEPEPAPARAAPRGGGARGPSGPEPWKKLGDQTRTKAYDYEKDYGDERNMRAVDRWGRSRQEGPARAQAPSRAVDLSGGPMGGQGRNPQGAGGPGAGMSSNNATNDLAASQGAANFAEHTFHLGQPDANSAKGYEALASGHGAPDIATIDKMRQTIDPEGKLPPNEMMRQLRNKTHEFYMAQGDKAKADKTAFEVSQFGNVMAKSHGANAQKMIAKGDVQGAIHEIAAGYNWLPNGHTVSIDPSGKNAVIEGPDGKVVQQIPLTPEILKQVSAGMAHGVFNWDVMNGGGPLPAPGLNGPQLGAQSDRGSGGGGGGGQAISPTLPPPVRPPAAAGAQPAAAPAGPPAPPQAAPPSSPAAAPTSGTPGGVPGAPAAAPPPAAPPPPATTGVTAAPPPTLTPRPLPTQTTVPSTNPASRPQTKPAPQAQTQPTSARPVSSLPVQSHADAQAATKPGPSAAPAEPAKAGAPAEPAKPDAPAPANRPARYERPKELTPEERKASLEKKYKDDPDYIPDSTETPPIRRGSRNITPVDPREWTYQEREANQSYADKIRKIDEIAKRTKDARPADLSNALKHVKDEHEKQLKHIADRKKDYEDNEKELNRQETQRVDDRKIQSAAPDTTVHKVINNEMTKVVEKYKKFDPLEEGQKKNQDKDFAKAHNSPLRYMGTEEARSRLGDIARQIWQVNAHPDMSEKQAVEHAIAFTSFVSGKPSAKDINGNNGEKGRTYRAIGYDTMGNVVLATKGGDTVHVPSSTFDRIKNLRAANHRKFQEEMKDLNDPDKQVSSTRSIIERGAKELRKLPVLDPMTGAARAVGEAIGATTKKPDTSDDD